MSPRSKALVVATAAALALTAPTLATAAPAAAPSPSPHAFAASPSKGKLSPTVTASVLDKARQVNVMVQLKGDPVAVAEARSGRSFTTSERTGVKKQLRKAQDAIAKDIADAGGTVLSKLQSAYNGMQVRISKAKADSLASLPGVIAVHALTPKTVDNTVSVPFLGVPQVWQDTGYTGRNVKVAVIDTGIDYTHADFAGPGTTAAWDEAHAASAKTPDSSLIGPLAPRIKGGYDFVGDEYDATGENGSTTPVADSNPLDCNGHGSHVAGTIGGSGVTSDGNTYTGAYNADTEKTSFKVGPGVAPQADLYALKVFGCQGSTDVVTEAIDWAVDHGMDVINMSLGSTSGASDDPDAVAASNAVAAGVVVVASAGNSGPSPYLLGSPASGHGVLSVAAVDSSQTFPGANIDLGSSTVKAINANGAELPSSSLKVVVVADDPDTSEVESLGCSKDAFTKAGITEGGGQLAVVSRGTCARVAKAIFGQQAGAAAVLMINSTDGFPPYEGAITSNPDDSTPYTVTIPFLGVQSTSGAAIKAAAGSTVTLSSTTVDNPSFRGYASFTSSGPSTGESAVGPAISAPGVSISSVGMGAGTGAAIESGTSMAAPHVAGVAALTVQAHPTWVAKDIAATLGSTADPTKVASYEPVLGGGLVNPAGAVATQAFATGDSYTTTAGKVATATLSYGFVEPSTTKTWTKQLTITNKGSKAITYTLSSAAASSSLPAKVSFSTKKVKVNAHSTAKVKVSLRLAASAVGSSLSGDDQFAFFQASGNVVLTSSAGTLRVPYLLVPRADAKVSATVSKSFTAVTGSASTSAAAATIPSALKVSLKNKGALAASADFYTWGVSDARDRTRSDGQGYDLRAAGVQAWDGDDGKTIVFAVNTWDRWSNAASNEFDVSVDTNGDGRSDWVVFSYDSGAVRADSADGLTEVFLQEVSTGDLYAAGFYARAPTDSSTILLPVLASDLGLDEANGSFTYTVSSAPLYYVGGDSIPGSASYNPWAKAIEDADYVTVKRGGTAKLSVPVNAAAFAAQKPLGLLAVVLDNHSGSSEAATLSAR